MSEFVTTSFSVGPIGAGASLVYAAAIGHNQARLFKTKVVPVGGTGTFDHGIYKHATCLAADVVAAWQAVPTSPGLFDPMESAGSGPTERNEGEPIFYEDLDAGSNIHGKITNNDAGSRSFNVSITYQIGETTDFVLIEGAAPTLRFSQPGATADERYWQMSYGSHQLFFQLVNDALSVAANFMVVNRSGNTVSSVVFPSSVGVGGVTPLQALDVTGNLRISGSFMRADNAGAALTFGNTTHTYYNDVHQFRTAGGAGVTGQIQSGIMQSFGPNGSAYFNTGNGSEIDLILNNTVVGQQWSIRTNFSSLGSLDLRDDSVGRELISLTTAGIVKFSLGDVRIGPQNASSLVIDRSNSGTGSASINFRTAGGDKFIFGTGVYAGNDTTLSIGDGSKQLYSFASNYADFRVENVAAVAPRFSFCVTDGGSDQKRWQIVATTNLLYFSALNDAENAETQWLIVNRGTGTAIASIVLNSLALGFFNVSPVAQQTAAAFTNNITVGGTNDQATDWTNLTVYSTDAAAIRDAVYQCSRKIAQLTTGLRNLGLFA